MKRFTFMIHKSDKTRELVYTDAPDLKSARAEMTRLFKPLGIRYELNPRKVEDIQTATPVEDRTNDFNMRFKTSDTLGKLMTASYFGAMVIVVMMIMYFVIR